MKLMLYAKTVLDVEDIKKNKIPFIQNKSIDESVEWICLQKTHKQTKEPKNSLANI